MVDIFGVLFGIRGNFEGAFKCVVCHCIIADAS